MCSGPAVGIVSLVPVIQCADCVGSERALLRLQLVETCYVPDWSMLHTRFHCHGQRDLYVLPRL